MFIALEGIDGAGKSTVAGLVGDMLAADVPDLVIIDKKTPPIDGYCGSHLGYLREIIWGHPADDPYYTLGDMHWIHLIASWFFALDEIAIRPLLAQGKAVLIDDWYYKSLGRMRLNPRVDQDLVESMFRPLTTPDLTILLDVDPAVAVRRKKVITAVEAGGRDGGGVISPPNFILYQRRLRRVLTHMARDHGWSTIAAEDEAAAGIAAAVASSVRNSLCSSA